ncbi:uncharacterized protein JCM10292_003218 [Rhodotorula paludigena]|uniref:uncharacterized protein n=1 Tax=Rhodotorula paludigena TaxID=86838 RepID=UPI003170D506
MLGSVLRPYLPARRDRIYLPLVVLACVLFLLYLQPHRPAYGYPLSRAIDPQASATGDGPITSSSLAQLVLPRFDKLLNTRILDYDSSLALESVRCPHIHLQSNRDQLANEGEHVWPTMTVRQLQDARDKVGERVKERFGWSSLESTGKSAVELEEMLGTRGRGLVFTAGNKDTTSRLLTSLRILRKRHGCTLPVEIFAYPSEMQALGDVKTSIDELGGVTWREAASVRAEGAWKSFGIKGDAIARSSFSELLYLDSDNVPLVDPTFLFDSPTYQKHGIVLWPDYNRDSAANPVWRLLSHSCSPEAAWQAESGQLLVDKRARGGMNLVALEVARAMMEEEAFWFRLSGGDKDTFRFAFFLLSLPYSMAPLYPSALGGPRLGRPYRGHTFCGHTMLQHGLDGSREWDLLRKQGKVADDFVPDRLDEARDFVPPPPLFVHANVLKHTGYTLKRGATFKTVKRPRDARLAPHAAAARSSWFGPSRHDAVPALESIRQAGLPTQGICIDVWDAASVGGAGEKVEDAPAGAYEAGEVEVFAWEDEWGGLARGFEDMYYDEGGVAGAW